MTTTTSRWSIARSTPFRTCRFPNHLWTSSSRIRGSGALRLRASGRGRFGHPRPGDPDQTAAEARSAAFTSRISGSVTTRYAIAATVKKVALNVADWPSRR